MTADQYIAEQQRRHEAGDKLMEAHKDDAWYAFLNSIEVNQATATTARALFHAGWDAALLKAAGAFVQTAGREPE